MINYIIQLKYCFLLIPCVVLINQKIMNHKHTKSIIILPTKSTAEPLKGEIAPET
jgi:hypothetical protein